MRASHSGRPLLGLFVLSGFSGLIYQSIWSHYLGLVLGHAAYAQTLVLAIFMGGMAIGAWTASRYGAKWRHLILAYAIIELAIGFIGLAFHPLFVSYIVVSQQSVLPWISNPSMAHLYQWLSSGLLILPQCVLLGMTFPILSAAYLRLMPDAPGQVLGGLYFTNSLGAAAGALASVFLLLPAVGMPGSMFTAGLLNVIVALGAWMVWKATPQHDGADVALQGAASPQAEGRETTRLSRIALVAAFITGATSFVYEIGWVRLLNQVLGTTMHSFELMLAAFILGLAFGGYWIRWRAPHIRDAMRYAAIAQVMMGVAALLSVIVFSQSFHGVAWLLKALNRTDEGYALFNGGSAVAALAVMFPAAFFAGMTLPLFTLALLRDQGGERQIGRVYASNTLGAIVGVFITVHVLVPLLGIRLAIMASAVVDAGLGLYLLLRVSPRRAGADFGIAAVGTAAAVVVSLVLGQIDPRMMVAGVFRNGQARLAENEKVLYLRDGKTATVSVTHYADGVVTIATNGKPDAGMPLSPKAAPSQDEATMGMLGVIPLAMHPAPRNIAVIGWGSGLSTHTLLGSKRPRRVDTIEIEKAMYDGARIFHSRNWRAYEDPRSHVQFDDARTYFSTRNTRYDVIVSEPSNPWVSGVSSLFTEEFYQFLSAHLSSDGIIVQWIHGYELNDALLGTMIAALLQEFPNSDIYLTNTADLVIVGYKGRRHPSDWSVLEEQPLQGELRRMGLDTPAEFALRKVGGPEVLATYVRMSGARPYSDFYPTVALNAPRSRFKRETALALLDIVDRGIPVLDLLDGRIEPATESLWATRDSRFSDAKVIASAMRDTMMKGTVDVRRYARNPSATFSVEALLRQSSRPIPEDELQIWTGSVATVAFSTLNQLPPEQQIGVWIEPRWIDREGQPPTVVAVLDALDAAARRDPARMTSTALKVLEAPDGQVHGYLREQMLVLAELGAIAQGQAQRVGEMESRFSETVQPSPYLRFLRPFLGTWAQRVPEPQQR